MIRPSPLGGWGTFAADLIPRGQLIRSLTGEVVTEAELDSRIRRGAERMDDSIRVGPDAYLDLDRPSRLFNHSCDPNAGVRGRADVFALRDIRQGEEVTFDYSTTVSPLPPAYPTPYPESAWRMACACRSPRCRGVIGHVLTIPAADLATYQRLGALPDLVATFLAQRQP